MAKKKNLADRMNAKFIVDASTGCWVWTAGRFPAGYGMIAINSKPAYAHRVMY